MSDQPCIHSNRTADFCPTCTDQEKSLVAAAQTFDEWADKVGYGLETLKTAPRYDAFQGWHARDLEVALLQSALSKAIQSALRKAALAICWRCEQPSEWKPIAEDGTHESTDPNNTVHEWCDSRLIYKQIYEVDREE